MKFQISARSHVGLVRNKNEDNFCVSGMILPEQKPENYIYNCSISARKPVFVGVFDGMGGCSAGERASFVMAQIAGVRTQNQETEPEQLLMDICMEANLAVCREMAQSEGLRMGTTASMLMLQKKKYTICNIGNSPVFRFRKGLLEEIHQEHTERATYESVTGKPAPAGKKFRLTQNIGMFPDEILIEPYCATEDPMPGDVYLICSDGITDMVPPTEMLEILKTCKDVDVITRSLEERALAAGGKDNATVICIRVTRGL